jgi:hypothetical protein
LRQGLVMGPPGGASVPPAQADGMA